jgi:L-amino acid N-acyltransferase YncA
VLNILTRAKEKGFKEVMANIYSFNAQSQKMFESVGFRRTEEEWYCHHITEE